MSDNLIADYFLQDPLTYKKDNTELDAIIEHYRGNRIKFTTAHKTTKSATQTKKVMAAEEKAKEVGIDLGDIEI